MENPASVNQFLSLPRVRLWSILLALAGAGVTAALLDFAAVAAFLTGALASWYNFLLLHAMVRRLGGEPTQGSRKVMTLFALRYLGLGALGYATLILFGTNPAVFCVGLLVAVFAMLFEVTIELIYARA